MNFAVTVSERTWLQRAVGMKRYFVTVRTDAAEVTRACNDPWESLDMARELAGLIEETP